MAQYPPTPDVVVAAHKPAVQVLDENNDPLVGSSILSAVTLRAAAEPPGTSDQKRAEPGGKTWSDLVIVGVAAAAVLAIILLLKRGDKAPAAGPGTSPAPRAVVPEGTVLAPGTPSVSSPRQ